MNLNRRAFGAFVSAALILTFLAFARSVHGGAPLAQAQSEQCMPDYRTAHGMLPQPPVVIPAQVPNHRVTLDVLQGPSQGNLNRFCYRIAGSTQPYVDAPTIVVRQGETFDLVLVDKIPASGPTMAPDPVPTTADGCAQLPYDPAMPAPNATPGYLGRNRVYATPPAMISNDTNIHTHGWHVSPDVDDVFKSLAMTKGGACSYTFAVPVTQPAGTYWYHAHMHGLAYKQVGGGLAGALIVTAANPTPSPLPERLLLLKNSVYALDAKPARRVLLANASIKAGNPGATTVPSPPPTFNPYDPPSWPSGWAVPSGSQYCPPYTSSSFISHWMLNGYPIADPLVHVAAPVSTLAPGSKMLYRIVDAMSDSYANIRMLDANGNIETLDVVGRDGVPVSPNGNAEGLATTFTNVLLPPAGRVDIVVTGNAKPQSLIADSVCTGYAGETIPRRTLLKVMPGLQAAQVARAVTIPLARAGQTAADRAFAQNMQHIVRRRAITFTQYMDVNKNMAWYVTDTSSGSSFQERPFWLSPDLGGKQRYLPTIRVPQNSIEEWTLVNASPEVHAFHIHQLTFITESNPFEGDHLHVFQDTVALPAAKIDPTKPANGDYPFLKPSLTKILIDFRGVHKGTFVYHCHMLFHEDRGMMGIIQVY